MSQKTVDLLKVAAGADAGAIEARLEGDPAEAVEAPFPEGFSASGLNSSVKLDEVRPDTDGSEPEKEKRGEAEAPKG